MAVKSQTESLAIFGGAPSFDEKLYVGCPNVGDRGRLLVRNQDILETRRLTNGGPYLQEFEKRIAEIAQVKHCIATSNATAALEIAVRAAGLTGEVIVPSFTFIATAHALRWQGITPVFCDIDPHTYNIDPELVDRLITPQTTGIIGVHLWGRPCDVEALSRIAQRRKLEILFDAAHAFGCSYRGRPIGNFGRAEIFSFHATKFINSFEGGAVVTNDHELAAKVRLMQNFGFAGYDDVVEIGINGKMSEAAAAMGLTSIESMTEFTEINRRNYLCYQEELADIPGIYLIGYDEKDSCNYQYIVLEIDEVIARLSRDELQKLLWAENVIARRYFYPGCHRMAPYLTDPARDGQNLPWTERLAARVLLLPTGTAIDQGMIKKICRIIGLAVSQAQAVRERLSPGAVRYRG